MQSPRASSGGHGIYPEHLLWVRPEIPSGRRLPALRQTQGPPGRVRWPCEDCIMTSVGRSTDVLIHGTAFCAAEGPESCSHDMWEWVGMCVATMVWFAQFPEIRLSRSEFEQMPEHSLSVPTGVRPGKRWRRNETVWLQGEIVWLQGEYVEVPGDKTKCTIQWSLIIVT
jgi:hypothetical protein